MHQCQIREKFRRESFTSCTTQHHIARTSKYFYESDICRYWRVWRRKKICTTYDYLHIFPLSRSQREKLNVTILCIRNRIILARCQYVQKAWRDINKLLVEESSSSATKNDINRSKTLNLFPKKKSVSFFLHNIHRSILCIYFAYRIQAENINKKTRCVFKDIQ